MKKSLILLVFLGLFYLSCSKETTEPDTSPIVYITNTGNKYHLSGCKYLADSKIQTTLNEAKKKGYTACTVCNPPN